MPGHGRDPKWVAPLEVSQDCAGPPLPEVLVRAGALRTDLLPGGLVRDALSGRPGRSTSGVAPGGGNRLRATKRTTRTCRRQGRVHRKGTEVGACSRSRQRFIGAVTHRGCDSSGLCKRCRQASVELRDAPDRPRLHPPTDSGRIRARALLAGSVRVRGRFSPPQELLESASQIPHIRRRWQPSRARPPSRSGRRTRQTPRSPPGPNRPGPSFELSRVQLETAPHQR